ncbi:MAG: ASCH domain-containing protein [Thermoleophilia bacterium]|nr:ASCH domain-containing protein [Thermoleophilia bacterium]MDH4346377.1 ASCH domain-containing protein [Thermoleophilia bacterium]MDH5333266.1 ASCH domain-containing protein [Thermoleophilia bacterium]
MGARDPAEGLPHAEFGFPGPLRDRLVAAILSGAKTSTTGLLEELRREGEAPPEVGDRALVVDSDGVGVAVIEVTAVDVRRMADVDLAFAIDEGEGFETVEDWRAAHVRFFTSAEMVAALGDPPVSIDDDTLVVCERFRLVSRPEPGSVGLP